MAYPSLQTFAGRAAQAVFGDGPPASSDLPEAADIASLTRLGEERPVIRLQRLVGQLHTGEGMGPV